MMNTFDRQFQTGSPLLIALFSAIALFFLGLSALEPEQKYLSLVLVLLSLSGAWKNYLAYQRRKQGSFDLLEEEA
jgi:hypothetical protein